MIYDASRKSGLRVIRSHADKYPDEVKDRKSGVTGSVNYDGAQIVEVHDDGAGHFAVPITTSNGRHYYLSWRFAGEFDAYEGLVRGR